MGILGYGLGPIKHVGTKNHCFNSKISQYEFIFAGPKRGRPRGGFSISCLYNRLI